MGIIEKLKHIAGGQRYQEISAPSDLASDGYSLNFQEAMVIYQRLAGEAAQKPQGTRDLEPNMPTLRSLYEDGTILVDPSKIVAGVTSEWQPVELDLRNGDGTSVLMVSDNIENARAVIQTMIDSIIYNDNPRVVVRYALVTDQPKKYTLNPSLSFADRLRNYGLVASYSGELDELIQELAELAEQRRSGRQKGPSVILFIDDLGSVSKKLISEVEYLLPKLIKDGPNSGIWTIASLAASEADSKFDDVYAAFGTVILGQTRGSRNSACIERWINYAKETCQDPSTLKRGEFIGSPPSDEWFAFRPLG